MCIKMTSAVLVLVQISCFACLVSGQYDGNFWWTNKQLLDKATESRNRKEINFKSEMSEQTSSNRSSKYVLDEKNFPHEDDEDSAEAADCTCVPRCQCQDVMNLQYVTENHLSSNKNNPFRHPCAIRTDVCCQLIKLPIPYECVAHEREVATTTTTSTTTQSPPYSSLELSSSLKNDFFIFPDSDSDEEDSTSHPWNVRLFKKDLNEIKPICGATLLSDTAAITAQHCIRGSRITKDYMIETSDKQRRVVSEIISNSQFYSGGLFNDLAIIKWMIPLDMNDEVKVINISTKSSLDLVNCSMMMYNNNPLYFEDEEVLQSMQIMTIDICEAQIKKTRLGNRFRLHSNFLCATPKQSLCNGISNEGHSLICYENQNSSIPKLVGVMSWSISCDQPQIFVNVQNFHEWISDNINGLDLDYKYRLFN